MTWRIARKLESVGGVTLLLGSITVVALVVNVLLLLPGPQRALVGLTSDNGFIALYNTDNTELLASSHQIKRYGLFEVIHQHSNEATIIGPTTQYAATTRLSSFKQRAYGIAKVGNIVATNYNPQEIGGDPPADAYIAGQGTYTGEVSRNWDRSGYQVFAKDKTVAFFVYALRGDVDVFIDARLLSAEDIKAAMQ